MKLLGYLIAPLALTAGCASPDYTRMDVVEEVPIAAAESPGKPLDLTMYGTGVDGFHNKNVSLSGEGWTVGGGNYSGDRNGEYASFMANLPHADGKDLMIGAHIVEGDEDRYTIQGAVDIMKNYNVGFGVYDFPGTDNDFFFSRSLYRGETENGTRGFLFGPVFTTSRDNTDFGVSGILYGDGQNGYGSLGFQTLDGSERYIAGGVWNDIGAEGLYVDGDNGSHFTLINASLQAGSFLSNVNREGRALGSTGVHENWVTATSGSITQDDTVNPLVLPFASGLGDGVNLQLIQLKPSNGDAMTHADLLFFPFDNGAFIGPSYDSFGDGDLGVTAGFRGQRWSLAGSAYEGEWAATAVYSLSL